MDNLENLLNIMARLRNPENGCAWDVAQDFASIAPYTIEEAYEVADAIARGDMDGLREELGDLLLQVVFHSRMAEEAGLFDFAAVAESICEKMLRRHPHVFGSEEERRRGLKRGAWEQIKAAERAAEARRSADSALDGVAQALPALKRAEKLGQRAASVGFDWPDAQGTRAKISEELAELSAAECAGNKAAVEEELGDVLFSVVNLARHLQVDPEHALASASRKFETRFRRMEADATRSGVDLHGLGIDALESRWQEAKKRV